MNAYRNFIHKLPQTGNNNKCPSTGKHKEIRVVFTRIRPIIKEE